MHEYKTYDVIVTDIKRTRDEQIAIYTQLINPKTNKLYKAKEVPYTVHGTDPCRGLDFYFTERGYPLAMDDFLEIEKHINDTFEYDPKRPHLKVCNFHKTSISGYHIHLQSHPNTIKRSLSIV